MTNTYPFSRVIQSEHEDYSLPFPLIHKQLDRTPLNLPRLTSKNDGNYIPDDALTVSESSFSSSDVNTSAFSRSSYDPLENLEEYLKMRDKL
jgi:hypothetical protein